MSHRDSLLTGASGFNIEGMGRPSNFTPDMIDKIAQGIAEDKSFKEIASSLGIREDTIFNNLHNNEEFRSKYQWAKQEQARNIEQQITDVIEDVRNGLIQPDAGRVVINGLTWRAKVTNPRVYGDKTILSNDPDNPVSSLALRLDTAIVQRNKLIDVTPEEAETPALEPPSDGSDLV